MRYTNRRLLYFALHHHRYSCVCWFRCSAVRGWWVRPWGGCLKLGGGDTLGVWVQRATSVTCSVQTSNSTAKSTKMTTTTTLTSAPCRHSRQRWVKTAPARRTTPDLSSAAPSYNSSPSDRQERTKHRASDAGRWKESVPCTTTMTTTTRSNIVRNDWYVARRGCRLWNIVIFVTKR